MGPAGSHCQSPDRTPGTIGACSGPKAAPQKSLVPKAEPLTSAFFGAARATKTPDVRLNDRLSVQKNTHDSLAAYHLAEYAEFVASEFGIALEPQYH